MADQTPRHTASIDNLAATSSAYTTPPQSPAGPVNTAKRRSIFNDGLPSPSRPSDLSQSSPNIQPGLSAFPQDGFTTPPPQRPPLAAPTIAVTPLLGHAADLRMAHRPRIPRVEKDADDPTSVQREALLRQETSTPTTLTRLFAVNAPEDSRSPSFNAATEFRPRMSTPEITTLTGHLHHHGLLSGKYSDVKVHAFGNTYNLHRLLIARAPFFNTALSGHWIESTSREITLHPADVDASINKQCFELALKRLYGVQDEFAEAGNPAGCFATGCWLEMTDMIEASIANMLRQMTPETLPPLIKLVTGNYYGRAGDKVLASSKAMLCRHGWRMALRNWDNVPTDIIREIVGGDGFFVSGEFDRWVLATRILNRRLRKLGIEIGLIQPGVQRAVEVPDAVKLIALRFDSVYRRNAVRTTASLPDPLDQWVALYTHPDIEPLLVLLDEGIHYMHLNYEHLQYIRKATDIFGLPVMPDKIVSDALWMQLELRQKVLNAPEDGLELGLSREADEPLSHPLTAHESTMSMTREPVSDKAKQQESIPAEEAESPSSHSWDGNGKPRKFWIPSTDCNIVMGGSSGPVVATSPTPSAARHVSRLSGSLHPEDVQWAADFGAAAADTRPVPGMETQLTANVDLQPVSYSLYPPFRFATEFQNPRLLKGRKRFYSKTIFYAGSLWNIYIQKLRAAKLGVYLHRAKIMEADDPVVHSNAAGARTVDERIGLLEREMLLRHERIPGTRLRMVQVANGEQGFEDESSGSGEGEAGVLRSDGRQLPQQTSPSPRFGDLAYRKSRQSPGMSDHPGQSRPSLQTRHSSYSPPGDDHSDVESSDEDEPTTDPELIRLSGTPQVHTLPPYIDARPKIKTYFKIYSPSKGGRMLSVYESVPSNFNFSQSWGWKSSTLMLDEGFEGTVHVATLHDELAVDEALVDGAEDAPKSSLTDGKLRFMVVIGNV